MQSNSLIDKMTAHVQTIQFSGYGNGFSPQQLSVFFEDFDTNKKALLIDKENVR